MNICCSFLLRLFGEGFEGMGVESGGRGGSMGVVFSFVLSFVRF